MQYKGASRPPCDVLPSLIKLEKARIDKIKRCEDKIPESERHHRRAHGLAFASDRCFGSEAVATFQEIVLVHHWPHHVWSRAKQ